MHIWWKGPLLWAKSLCHFQFKSIFSFRAFIYTTLTGGSKVFILTCPPEQNLETFHLSVYFILFTGLNIFKGIHFERKFLRPSTTFPLWIMSLTREWHQDDVYFAHVQNLKCIVWLTLETTLAHQSPGISSITQQWSPSGTLRNSDHRVAKTT